jgi:flagellar motor switch protein FliG
MSSDATRVAVEKMEPVERAAILLLALGEVDAAEILKRMEPKEVQRVGSTMANIRDLKNDQILGVLEYFLGSVGDQSGLTLGADGYIRNMLTSALGEDKAKGLLDRILGGNTAGLDKLKWMDARMVADFIRFEHPQIQATVLSYLDADQAAEVLSYFPNTTTRVEVIMRIASLESIPPQALQELNAVLEQQFSGKSSGRFANLGGVKVASEIMNNLDQSLAGDLMEGVKQADQRVGLEIEDLMFVFENLVDVDDKGIQTLLREVSSENLLMALKGADDVLKEKVFRNMSKRAAEVLREDLEGKGPVRLSEVQAAQKEVLNVARRLSESGQIALGGAGGEAMI